MIHKNILETIGNTPIVEYKTINTNKLFIKLEGFNPGGSIKDRIALGMVKGLIKDGVLNKESTVVEATSGNTGIGLALVLSYMKISFICVMPENMSIERQNLMRAYGVKIILTKKEDGMDGAIKEAKRLEKDNKYVYINQFFNKYNVLTHKEKTAKEIISDFSRLDILLAGIGTSGTIIGLSKTLKKKFPNLEIIGVEPYESSVLNGLNKGSHGIQGIGAGFIPPLYDKTLVDEIIRIKTTDAFKKTNALAKNGLFVGISSGAAILAGEEIAKKKKGKNILIISPDGGMKYLTTGVYNNEYDN